MGVGGASAETAKRYDSAVHKWVARISSLLAGKTPELRMAGILLAKHTSLQCPPIFVENALKWTTSLLNILGKAEIVAVYVAALQLLLAFMDIVREVPELQREIASAQVPRMNQAVLALADKHTEVVDTALELLMFSASWFPTLYRPSIDKTEALCLRLLNGTLARANGATCKRAASCLASLPLVGGKMTAEERWFQYAQQTIVTIELCIDHIMCVDRPTDNRQAPGMPAFADDFIVSIPQAADRITSMAELLIALLARPLNVDVPVPVDVMVGVASKLAMIPVRVASSSSNSNKSARAEFGLVPLLAPQLQRASIRVLAALAVALGEHMQPYLSAVARVMAAVNSKQVASATTQVALYSLVRLYVERYGYGFVVCVSKELIASVVGDVNVQSKRQVSATAGSALSASLSTKKRGGGGSSKSHAAEVVDSDSTSSMLLVQYTDVVYSALQAVLALLRHTPTALGAALRAQLDGQVLTLLMLEMVGGLSSPGASRSSDVSYKVALCQCLQASIQSPDPWQKAVVPHAVSVFTAGLEDRSMAVRTACLEGLAAIEPILHARLPAQLREPDTDKGFELERHVPNALLDSQVSLSAGISGSAFAESLDTPARVVPPQPRSGSYGEDEEEEDEREIETSTKRFKNISVHPAADTPLAASEQQTPQPPRVAAAEPKATPAPPAAPAPKPSLSKKVDNDGDEEEEDDIPDIVMEGSDSEDE
ncbi:hypothetical protein H4R26_001865 [Coemansia thaxteri]|uniref:Pre-rRNA-processing protein RIX1 n=1 Tax=Coemansia thaxteri TaxID=2663907 RepID=A0A9W8EGH5_9FUNG|nr:hypothetical protein H4R26_001865 [Coemansia thaxteri]